MNKQPIVSDEIIKKIGRQLAEDQTEMFFKELSQEYCNCGQNNKARVGAHSPFCEYVEIRRGILMELLGENSE